MRRFLLISAAFAASSLAAHAADLPLRGNVPDVEPTGPGFSWTGAYAGVNAGYAFDNEHDYWVAGNQPVTKGAVANGVAPAAFRSSADGFTGGLQIGYNYEIDGAGFGAFGLGALPAIGGPASLVVGAEADAAYTDIQSRDSFAGAAGFTSRFSSRTDYIGTVRGRVGVAFGPMFVYGTGGFAYGGVRSGISGSNPYGVTLFSGGRDSMRTGIAYGGGLEYAVPTSSFVNVFNAGAITAKAEFIRYDLGTESIAVTGNKAAYTTGQSFTVRDRYTGDLVRVGLNYKLDFLRPAPVIARY